MNNLEKLAARQRAKTNKAKYTTQKTKKMSNTNPTPKTQHRKLKR
jgi:hypothetical protein